MSTDTTVRAVLCDLGGVLITQRPDPREVLSVLGLSVEEHHIDLVDRAIWAHRDAYDDGCSDREFWDCIAGDRPASAGACGARCWTHEAPR